MADEALSLKRALEFIKKEPTIILPYIFGLIIAAVIALLAASSANEIMIAFHINAGTGITNSILRFIALLIVAILTNFFMVLAIFWQTFSSADLVDTGKFSVRTALSDSFETKGIILMIAIFISFVDIIISFIPIVGGLVASLFVIVAYVSIIVMNYNKKGLVRNITGMITTLGDIYKKEPTTGLFLGLMMLLYIVPNSLLEEIILVIMVIYGSLVLKQVL